MFRALNLALLTVLFASCASSPPVKIYSNAGSPNLFVQFETDDTFFSSNSLYVDLFENFPSCQYRYLGQIKISETKEFGIAVPVKKSLSFRTSTLKSNFLSSRTIHNQHGTFNFQASAGERYELEIYRKNDLRGETLYRNKNGNRIEIESTPDRCETYTEI